MKNYKALQLQYSIHQQRLELMIQKYGLRHPKVLLQSQKVDNIFVQLQNLEISMGKITSASLPRH